LDYIWTKENIGSDVMFWTVRNFSDFSWNTPNPS